LNDDGSHTFLGCPGFLTGEMPPDLARSFYVIISFLFLIPYIMATTKAALIIYNIMKVFADAILHVI
jgi:hypothetical protein